jgi:signal transduction histidine kinase
MQERARSVGGTLRIRSRAGRGTLVSFLLPLDGQR